MSAAPHSQHTRRKCERKSKLNLLDGNRLQNGSLISNYDLINFMAAVSEFCLASIIPAGFQVWPAFFFFFFLHFQNEYYDKSDIWKKGRKAQEVVDQRSEVGAAEAAVPGRGGAEVRHCWGWRSSGCWAPAPADVSSRPWRSAPPSAAAAPPAAWRTSAGAAGREQQLNTRRQTITWDIKSVFIFKRKSSLTFTAAPISRRLFAYLVLRPGGHVLQQVDPIHHHALLLLHWSFEDQLVWATVTVLQGHQDWIW